jgi:hypothetical protein
MTTLRINTLAIESEKVIRHSLELRPVPDEECQTVIEKLGIIGIGTINTFADRHGETWSYEFPPIEAGKLDDDAKKLTLAMRALGTEVLLNEEIPRVPHQPGFWGGLAIRRKQRHSNARHQSLLRALDDGLIEYLADN